MTARDPIGFDAPPFCDDPDRPMADETRAWDYPLTPTVMVVLAFAAAFVAVLVFAGWLV